MTQIKITIQMDTDVKHQVVMEQSTPFKIYIPKSQEKLVVNFETKSKDTNIVDNASNLIISQNIDVFKELAK